MVSEEFTELEQDVELRRGGVERYVTTLSQPMFSALSQDRMFLASKGYHHSLSKKKDNQALENPEKLLPIDTFGIVMITHGEEFGSDSEFGMQ